MILISGSLLAGLILLTLGAEGLVRGSSALALRMGVSPLIVGLTIVAFGTSMPEMVVSGKAALDGYGGIAIGNVVGSNIFNIAVILGFSALIQPLKVNLQVIRLDLPAVLLSSFLLLLFFQNEHISRTEGGIFLAGMLIYTVGMIVFSQHEAAKTSTPEPQVSVSDVKRSPLMDGLFILGGLGLLVIGAQVFVDGAVKLAELLGVSRAVIGLTIIAAGTSLPELATSISAAVHKETDIAIGNVVGSNLFNILGILGVSSLISPLNGSDISMIDMYVMLGAAVMLLPFMRTGFTLNRWEGGVLLCVYGGYLYYLWPK